MTSTYLVTMKKMEIAFAKVGSILRYEASCEKNEKNFYVISDTIFLKTN